MIIRNKVVFYMLVVLLVFASIYIYLDRTAIKEAPLALINHITYDNAKDLAKDVELIVLATATTKSKNVIIKGEYVDGYSLTEIEIIKEIKNDGRPLNAKNITIIEPTFSIENEFPDIGKTQFYLADYRKTAPEATYFLFLNWDEKKEAYSIHSLHQGKFNVDHKDLKEKEVEDRNEQFMALKEDVIKTYFSEK